MMWPSQNFLLQNATIVKIKVNEWIIKNIYIMSVLPPPFGDTYNMHKLKQFNIKKELTIFIPVKYNHKCTKEINLMPSR